MRQITPDHLAAWIIDRASEHTRFLFGISGPPGSGKSTLAARLASELAAPVVPMDGFHLPNSVLSQRGLRDVKGAPETFDANGFVEVVRKLRAAETDVSAPLFDRSLDRSIGGAIQVGRSESIVLIEGNYLLLGRPPWDELRHLLNAIAHLEVPRELLRDRLVSRHVAHGRSVDEATRFVEESDLTNAALVKNASARADLVVVESAD